MLKRVSSSSSHHNIPKLPSPSSVAVTVPSEEFATDSTHEQNRPSIEGRETYYPQELQSSQPATSGKRRSSAAMAAGTTKLTTVGLFSFYTRSVLTHIQLQASAALLLARAVAPP